MRTSEERVAELHRRMETMRRAKIRRKYRSVCAMMIVLCLAVTVGFAMIVARTPGQAPVQGSSSTAASIFAEQAALGYIVVALVALCLGVLVTVFCFRLKRHMEKEGERDD